MAERMGLRVGTAIAFGNETATATTTFEDLHELEQLPQLLMPHLLIWAIVFAYLLTKFMRFNRLKLCRNCLWHAFFVSYSLPYMIQQKLDSCGRYTYHTVISYNVSTEQLEDWAELAGIEVVIINKNTSMLEFRNELRWNDTVW